MTLHPRTPQVARLVIACLCATVLACGATSTPPPRSREPARAVADAGAPSGEPMRPAAPAVASRSDGKPVVRTDRERGLSLYAPASIELRDGRFDLIVHFHGPFDRAMASVDQAGVRAVLVNVDIGTGSAVYQDAFEPEDSLRRVREFAEKQLDESHRLERASTGRVALSAWSAGFGAVREILKRSEDMVQVEAVLLADGFFTDWRNRRHGVKVAPLDDAFAFAHRASRGTRLFVLTHTSIDGGGYAGPGECAAALIQDIGAKLGPPHAPDVDAGGTPAYAVDIGELHVWGFGGTTWDDHVAQHRAMGVLHYRALKAFWEAR